MKNKRTSINKKLKTKYKLLQKAVSNWFNADDGTIEGLARDTYWQEAMYDISEDIKKLTVKK